MLVPATIVRSESHMTAAFPAAAFAPEIDTPLILALPKGRILDECGPLLDRAGVHARARTYRDDNSRRLRFPTADAAARRGAGAALRCRHLRGIRRRAYRHLRRRRADGVRLPRDLRPARPRHRRLPGQRRGTGRDRTTGSDDPATWSRVRVATKYPNIARKPLTPPAGCRPRVVHLNGAMELAPGLGLSRLIVDLVQTGSTLKRQRPGRRPK